MKKIITALALILIVCVGLWYFMPSNNMPEDTTAAPFIITDVAVEKNTLKIDDGNPQTDDGEFRVTWKIQGGESLDDKHTFLTFGMVDENGSDIVNHFYGGGVTASFRDGNRILNMPPLCSSLAVDSCFNENVFTANKKYRLKTVGVICADKDINPFYCPDESRTLTKLSFSNWFTLSR